MSTPDAPEPQAPQDPAAPQLPDPAQQQFAQPQYAAPQHPYAQPVAQAKPARGLAIASMALGLAALVTVIVAALYAQPALIIGLGLGIAAVVLGIIGLVRRGPMGPGITGLISGAIAVSATAFVLLFSLGTAGLQAVEESLGGSNQTQGDEQHSDDDAQVPSSDDVVWPKNLAAGGMLFTGEGDGLRVIETEQLPPNSFPADVQPYMDEAGATDLIQVYIDYRCPACLMFEEANVETLERAAKAGAVVNLQPLTFLDGVSAGNYYSSRAAAAMACVVENDPEIGWQAHRALLNADFQPAEGIAGHDNAVLIKRLEAKAGELSDQTRSCITEEQHVTFSQALSNWFTTNPVAGANDPTLTVSGTPTVVVNGDKFDGDITDAAAFESFLKQQGVLLK